MIDFIKDNYKLILLILACVLELAVLVISSFRKKVDPSVEKVISYLPYFISKAEEKYGAGKGNDKKAYVIQTACDCYEKLTGVLVSDGSLIYQAFSKAIEEILNTPQKKGK